MKKFFSGLFLGLLLGWALFHGRTRPVRETQEIPPSPPPSSGFAPRPKPSPEPSVRPSIPVRRPVSWVAVSLRSRGGDPRQGVEALFEIGEVPLPRSQKPLKWELAILNGAGAAVKAFKGRGSPPGRLIWDASGEALALEFGYRLRVWPPVGDPLEVRDRFLDHPAAAPAGVPRMPPPPAP